MPSLPKTKRSLSARGHFVLFVVLLLLPILAFAGWLAARYIWAERARVEQNVVVTAQLIAAEIDRDHAELLAALNTLTTSRLLIERNFEAFHRQMIDARAYVGADIILRGIDGQRIADTREPWGAPLGHMRLPRDPEVLESRAARISGVFTDNASRETRYSIILPVLIDGNVAYLINYTIPTSRLVPYLNRRPEDIVSTAISDRNGKIVARSARHEEVSGTPGNAEFIRTATGRSGTWVGVNQDAIPVIVGYYRSPLSGWLISSSVPLTTFNLPLYASLKALAGFGLIALALSLGLALIFGRRIAMPLTAVARGAVALGNGEDIAIPRAGVREIDDVSQALEQSARELREREAELLRVQQIGRVGGLEVDLRDGFRNRRSAEYLRIHGLPPDATRETHESWVARIHPDDRVETEQHFRDTVTSNAADYIAEYRIVRPSDGAVRWISAKAVIERDESGKPLRLIGAHTDITEIKEAETALQQLNENLEAQVEERSAQVSQLQKLEAIGQLTGGIAHDFNNLLTAIVGNLELLKNRLPADADRLQRLIDNAMQGANRGAALTQRLLAFARRQELRPEAVDVAKLIEGMTELLRRSIGPLVEIETRIEPQLERARVDANQLELAILNLAVNSRDAMPKGGNLTITARNETVHSFGLSELTVGDYVVVSVNDTGEGMDETTLRRATEPFFTTKGVGKGTGLGLSMVHGLAAQSGGALRFRSAATGTSAELWLPRAEQTDTQHAAPAASPVAVSGQQHRVLLVDDDVLVLGGTAAILEDLNHVVIETTSARQALEKLRTGAAVDIVVTDHAMPGMTGVQLAAAIAAEWPAMPVILATGYADLPEGTEPGLPRLAKPFGQEALSRAIDTAIAAKTSATRP